MQIDLATSTDIPELCELLNVLFSQEAEFTPDPRIQARGLNQILTSPQIGLIVVARRHNRIIGMVSLLFTVSTALGERVALLEDFVVAPTERNGGIGSQLLDRALDYARLAGCRRITLMTDRANAAAQNFYRKHGFELSAMIPLRRSLTS